MLTRQFKIPKSLSFFLFGARATGKTTLLENSVQKTSTLSFNLLDKRLLHQFLDTPEAFLFALNSAEPHIQTIVIDEVQRAPQLLDVVQQQMGSKRFQFILTGSSARKLKRGHANLLGGRALQRVLWPLTCLEMASIQNCENVKMNWGGLPLVALAKDDEERKELLRAYEDNYLAEEIVAEQLVRNLTPFRRFLAVAAQMSGKLINLTRIGADLGVSHNTVGTYFDILEDTLLGFRLEPFHHSARKKLRMTPKFYLFDTGVAKHLNRGAQADYISGTSAYGDAFEHMVVLEVKAFCSYFKPGWQLGFVQTESGNEVDLVIDKGLGDPILIEIKSTDNVNTVSLGNEFRLMKDLRSQDCYVLSRDPVKKKFENGVKAMPWQEGLKEIFEL